MYYTKTNCNIYNWFIDHVLMIIKTRIYNSTRANDVNLVRYTVNKSTPWQRLVEQSPCGHFKITPIQRHIGDVNILANYFNLIETQHIGNYSHIDFGHNGLYTQISVFYNVLT